MILDARPWRLPDGTCGVAVGEVPIAGAGSEGGMLAPGVGDIVRVHASVGMWRARIREILGRGGAGLTLHVCRADRLRE